MNREIKFRAWDTKRKQFVPQGEIVFSDYGDTNIEVHPNDLSYVGDSCHNGEPQRGRFIITQFTGLHDKNNNPIYEGDLMRVTQRTVGNGDKTKYKDFHIPVEYYNGCFVLPFEDYGDYRFRDGDWTSHEIVGNIYESPLIK